MTDSTNADSRRDREEGAMKDRVPDRPELMKIIGEWADAYAACEYGKPSTRPLNEKRRKDAGVALTAALNLVYLRLQEAQVSASWAIAGMTAGEKVGDT